MANILEQVATYQMGELALMQNMCVFVSTANTKFKEFNDINTNLGDTVTFDLAPRFTTTPSLVADFQDVEQRKETLTIDKEASTSYAFSAQEFILNVEDYMSKFGASAMAELATEVESDVASEILNAPYRFYGDGVNEINSYKQLVKAITNYKNYGAPKGNLKLYLADTAVPDIIDNGLSQFVINRNEKDAQSWEIADFAGASYYMSNLLPLHTAGTVGQEAATLTVVSISADGSQITCSGATASDASAIKANDLIEFNDGVAGQQNIRFLTFIGHKPSSQKVQLRITTDAAADGTGNVVLSVSPAINSTEGDKNQNVNTPVTAGMQLKALPNHRRGLLCGDNAFYLAMPRLPEEVPFPTANAADEDTGVSIRSYYGSDFAKNKRGFVKDCIWGKRIVPERSMALIFPE